MDVTPPSQQGHSAPRRGMGDSGPEPQVGEDPLGDLRLVKKGNETRQPRRISPIGIYPSWGFSIQWASPVKNKSHKASGIFITSGPTAPDASWLSRGNLLAQHGPGSQVNA